MGKTSILKNAVEREATFKPANLHEQIIYSRAMEAVNWGMPLVNYELMYQAFLKLGGNFNQVALWPGLPDWRNQTLTPNPDVIYLMPFFNTKEVGPVVLEIPPADDGLINGSVMDCWQNAIEDVGPAGVDKGKGGKYLILPPGYKERVSNNYIEMQSDTFQGYALLRSVLKSTSDEDIKTAIRYAKRIKVYPLSQANNPPQTVFHDVRGRMFDSTIPYDLRFFQSLDRMIQSEVWLTRDKVMIDFLKTIGIEKGKTFHPDLATEEILNDAARDAHLWIDSRYDGVFSPAYFDKTHWALPATKEVVDGMPTFFGNPDSYPIDGRGVTYSMAFFSAKHLGEGQFYLMAIKDKNGEPFRGDSTYRLRVPANAPVKQYWSATAYDRETHAFIRDMDTSGRSSQSEGIERNPDGSVDVYFGPQAPPGKEHNWVPTNSKRGFEVLFRFYGPEKTLFDKSWRMGDVEKVDDRK